MQIKIRKVTPDGEVRLEAKVDIKEVMINESFMPDGENVVLGFRGKSSSGLIELKRGEAERLCRTLKGRLNLVKGSRILED
jgi:hypothetical protein